MPYVKTQPLFASNWISVQNQRGQTPTSKLKIEVQRIWCWEAPDALNAVYQIRIELSVSWNMKTNSHTSSHFTPFLFAFLFTYIASPSCSSPDQSGEIIPPTGRRSVHTQVLTARWTLGVRTLRVTIFFSNANTIAGSYMFRAGTRLVL